MGIFAHHRRHALRLSHSAVSYGLVSASPPYHKFSFSLDKEYIFTELDKFCVQGKDRNLPRSRICSCDVLALSWDSLTAYFPACDPVSRPSNCVRDFVLLLAL